MCVFTHSQAADSICKDIWSREERELQWNAVDKAVFTRLVAEVIGVIVLVLDCNSNPLKLFFLVLNNNDCFNDHYDVVSTDRAAFTNVNAH